MLQEYQRREFFFPNTNWKEDLLKKQLGDKLSITLVDIQGNKKRFTDLEIVYLQHIGKALYIYAVMAEKGHFYKLDLQIYEDGSSENRAFLYPTAWPIGYKKSTS